MPESDGAVLEAALDEEPLVTTKPSERFAVMVSRVGPGSVSEKSEASVVDSAWEEDAAEEVDVV